MITSIVRAQTHDYDNQSVIFSANGNIGIGTSNPTWKLDVNGNARFEGNLRFNDNLTIFQSSLLFNPVGAAGGDNFGFKVTESGNNTTKLHIFRNFTTDQTDLDRMVITSFGRVGIGTSSPTNGMLHLYHDSTIGGITGPDITKSTLRIEDATHSMYADGNSFFTTGNMLIGTLSNTYIALGANQQEHMRINTNGRIGIGTDSPDALLRVVDDSGIKISKSNLGVNSILTNGVEGLEIQNGNGVAMMSFDNSQQYVGIGLEKALAALHVADDTGLRVSNSDRSKNSIFAHGSNGLEIQNGGGSPMISFNNSTGKVAIGTGDFSGSALLRVEGEISSRKVSVHPTGPWPDFVFAEGYLLPSLEETEEFIQQNQHLPNVPSAAEVQAEGFDLGAMDATLLQKVEELTLYLIEMNKQMKRQNERIEQLEQENALLKKK